MIDETPNIRQAGVCRCELCTHEFGCGSIKVPGSPARWAGAGHTKNAEPRRGGVQYTGTAASKEEGWGLRPTVARNFVSAGQSSPFSTFVIVHDTVDHALTLAAGDRQAAIDLS